MQPAPQPNVEKVPARLKPTPMFDSGSNIYLLEGARLKSFAPDWTPRWQFGNLQHVDEPADAALLGDALFHMDRSGELTRLFAEGEVDWSVAVPGPATPDKLELIQLEAAEETMLVMAYYVDDETTTVISSFSSLGELNWQCKLAGIQRYFFALSDGGAVTSDYVSSIVIDRNGAVEGELPDEFGSVRTLAQDAQGRVYATNYFGELAAFEAGGFPLWIDTVDESFSGVASAILPLGEDRLLVSRKAKLYLWNHEREVLGESLQFPPLSMPVVAGDGGIFLLAYYREYASASVPTLVALDAELNVRWHTDLLERDVPAQLSVAPNGSVFAVSRELVEVYTAEGVKTASYVPQDTVTRIHSPISGGAIGIPTPPSYDLPEPDSLP